MRARLFQPARNAMQSGMGKSKQWILEFAPASAREIDPLMGWISSEDTQHQVRLRFDSLEAAKAYARSQSIEIEVLPAQSRLPNIRPGGYGENFATNRRGVWTH